MEKRENINRLQQEQIKALSETDARIAQLDKFKEDYKVLRERLTTLPDKITHDIMVPFGKLAFMPGQLVHTNEVTVLLGDNWFAQRSAKQAAEIVSRRVAAIDEQVQDLQKQRNLLQPRLDFTSELQEMSQQNVQEIREDYNEETEKAWKAKHAENVRNYKARQRAKAGHSHTGAPASDDNYMARLDELEVQERRQKLKKTVRWSDEISLSEEEDDSEEDDTDDAEDDDEDRNEDAPVLPSCIYFKHSPVSSELSDNSSQLSSHNNIGDTDEVSTAMKINSPADIYRQFHKPKSILKTATGSSQVHAHATTAAPKCTSIDGYHPDAVADTIVEHNPEKIPQSTSASTISDGAPKRISKFKAQRLAKIQR